MTTAAWLQLLSQDRRRAVEVLALVTDQAARVAETAAGNREDLAQRATLQVLAHPAALRNARQETPLAAWISGVIRNLEAKQARNTRRRRAHLQRFLREGRRRKPGGSRGLSEPELAVEAAWTTARLMKIIQSLPPPNRQIAALQLRQGASRKQIAACLQAWRLIGYNMVRALIVETHKMLRAAWEGRDLRTLWPRRFSTKNPWNITPPRGPGPL